MTKYIVIDKEDCEIIGTFDRLRDVRPKLREELNYNKGDCENDYRSTVEEQILVIKFDGENVNICIEKLIELALERDAGSEGLEWLEEEFKENIVQVYE